MNDTFLKACRGEKTDYTPVWVMRQAGRNLPQFRELLAKVDFLSLCHSPELAAEATLMPVDTFGVDAAILFSDMPLMVVPMGIDLKYNEKLGPVYANPTRSQADVDKLVVPDPEEGLPYLLDTIKLLVPALKNKVPLIGFGGCPLTLAAYMVEGGVSQRYFLVKSMLNQAPELFHALMAKVAKFDAAFLRAQLRAGADAVMMFENWGNILSYRDYLEFAYPYVKDIITSLKKEGKPVIYFADRLSPIYEQISDSGADVYGIDFRVRLEDAIKRLGSKVAVQGNLDPFVLLAAPRERMEGHVKEILQMGKKARGHIFNLGDGIQPETPVDNTKALVEAVHRLSRR
ncbi:MAG: uroporphyrinogen decarboxylase [Dehalococcoidia bacterium]|jgi:uroporphyrinogen decarboxylase|nr:MAG: uroporphyrinogen decarboxylase [Dehalococcoidia bacterium]